MIVSVALIAIILLQPRSGGLGSAFGGSDFKRTRRGAEKFVFNLTIALAVLFVLVSLLNIYLA